MVFRFGVGDLRFNSGAVLVAEYVGDYLMAVSDKFLLNLLRQVVSIRAGGSCEFPGCSNTECDPHHTFSRGNKSTRYNPDNCAWLCNEHHRWSESHYEGFRLIMLGLRGAQWWCNLTHAKNQVVKFNDAFRAGWKEKLQDELKRMAA